MNNGCNDVKNDYGRYTGVSQHCQKDSGANNEQILDLIGAPIKRLELESDHWNLGIQQPGNNQAESTNEKGIQQRWSHVETVMIQNQCESNHQNGNGRSRDANERIRLPSVYVEPR